MKKTIIYICHFAGTPENGMNYRPYFLGKYAVKMGYRFIVFGCGYDHQMKNPKNLTKDPITEVIDGINYIWLPSKKYDGENYVARIFNLFGFVLKLFSFQIKRYVESSDVLAVVSSSPSLLTSINGHHLAKKIKTNFVFEVRDILPMSLVELSNVSDYNPFIVFLKILERFSYKKAKKVFTVLPYAKEYMVRNGMKKNKFVYVPNGIDDDMDFSDISSECENLLNQIPQEKFIVGYAGTIGVANGLETFVKSAEMLKSNSNILFIIVGDGPLKDKLVSNSKNLNNLLFLPQVSKANVYHIIRKFDICYIGLKEGKMFSYGISPNKLFDYMLMSKPVIQAINTDNSIVQNEKCGIVIKPNNPDMLKSAILRLFQMDKMELECSGKRGREFVLKNHVYKEITKKFVMELSSI